MESQNTCTSPKPYHIPFIAISDTLCIHLDSLILCNILLWYVFFWGK